MSVPETAPGLALDWAWATITAHSDGGRCNGCRGSWCPTVEWSLWVVVTDRIVPVVRRPRVTVVARQVVIAHWPRTVDGCRPCGLPDCGRIVLANAWLTAYDRGWVPPIAAASRLSHDPTVEQLREITGMDEA